MKPTEKDEQSTAVQDDDWRKTITMLPCGHEVLHADQIHYCAYIGMPLIQCLNHAFPQTDCEREAFTPDEQQFIRVHQVLELAYEQMLYDLPRAMDAIVEDNFNEALIVLKRITGWMNLFPSMLSLFSTMKRESFAQFRLRLAPASGAESLNARRFEIRAGVEEAQMYVQERGKDYTYRQFLDRGPTPEKNDPKTRWWTEELSMLARQSSLRSVFHDALSRHRLTLETLHRKGNESYSLRLVADALYNLDCAFHDFQEKHFATASRQIGKDPGTGHTSGVPFLTSTKEHLRLFIALWTFRKAHKQTDHHAIEQRSLWGG